MTIPTAHAQKYFAWPGTRTLAGQSTASLGIRDEIEMSQVTHAMAVTQRVLPVNSTHTIAMPASEFECVLAPRRL